MQGWHMRDCPSGMYCTATGWKAGGTGRAPEGWLTDLGLIGIGGVPLIRAAVQLHRLL